MTLIARQSAHSGLMLVLWLVRLVHNLLILPFMIVRGVRYAIRSDGYHPDAQMLRQQLLIPVGDEADFPSD